MDSERFLPPAGRGPAGLRAAPRRHGAAQADPLLLAALDHAAHGLIILDRRRQVRLVSRPACEMLGLPGGRAALGQPILRLLGASHVLDAPALRLLTTMLSDPGAARREVLVSVPRHGSNDTRVLSLDWRVAGAHGVIISLTDVTHSQAAQESLLEHAATDPITGLWNRPHFMLMLHDRLAMPATLPAAQCALLLLNLRRFRQVNETLGTHAGDEVLRVVACRLNALLREDDMIARFAGDEFAVLAANIRGTEEALNMARRLAGIAADPVVIDEQRVEIGVAVGAACITPELAGADVLLDQAGLALAAAQALPGGGVRCFDPGLDENARARRALEADLRDALALRQFELHYQPQIELVSYRICGFEALIRWRHPVRGMVPPNIFIPVAEEIGIIGELGAWVLQAACAAAAKWPADVPVAVNVSPLQVEADGFEAQVADALRAAGLPGARLEIEVTESLLLHDTGTVTRTLAALRAQGVRLVLDDFGTGFASLSQLSRFRFDKLKIDRSFVNGADSSSEHSAIVRAVAALGTSLGIPTTAEGVETVMQLSRVREEGCTSVQGYYFSKPVPGAQVAALLENFTPQPCSPAVP